MVETEAKSLWAGILNSPIMPRHPRALRWTPDDSQKAGLPTKEEASYSFQGETLSTPPPPPPPPPMKTAVQRLSLEKEDGKKPPNTPGDPEKSNTSVDIPKKRKEEEP